MLGVGSKMLHGLLQNRLARFEELNRELRSTAVGQVKIVTYDAFDHFDSE